MNNPFNFLQAMANPQQFLQNMMNNSQIMKNPMMNNAIKMYQNGDTDGLSKLVNNVAEQKGTSVDEIRKNLGI